MPKSILKQHKNYTSIDTNESTDSDQNVIQPMRISVEVKRPTKKLDILKSPTRRTISSITKSAACPKTLSYYSTTPHQITQSKNKNSKTRVSDLQSRQKAFIRNLLEKCELSPSSSELTNTFKPAFMN